MTRFLLAIAAVLCAVVTLSAESIYIFAEDGCADRIRYQEASSGQMNNDYYAYAFHLPNGYVLTLETGMEGRQTQSTIPANYLSCNDSRLTSNLSLGIWTQSDQVFIIRRAFTGEFRVTPVVGASVMQKQGDQIIYTSKYTRFKLNQRYAELNTDISFQRPKASVILEGAEPGNCSPELLIQHKEPGSAHPLIQYRISPEIGLLERRLGSNGTTSMGSVIQARSVNGIPLAEYLVQNCARLKQGAATAGTGAVVRSNPYNNVPVPSTQVTPSEPSRVTPAPQPYAQPTPYVQQPYRQPAPQPESRAYRESTAPTVTTQDHRVVKGETLYGISRKYGTTADAIQRINGMSGTTIYPGQVLKISSTTSASAPAPTPYSAPAAAPTARAAAPVPNATVYQTDGKTRIVRAGETVASVAYLSGYTEERFRQINNLSPTDILYAGQRVITDHCNHSQPAPTTTAQPLTLPDTPQNQPYAPPAPPEFEPAPRTVQPRYGASAPSYTPPGPSAYNNAWPAYRDPTPAPAPAPAPRTLSQLEGRGVTPAPRQNPQPQPYARPQPTPQPSVQGDPFRGTPLNATPPAMLAPAQPQPEANTPPAYQPSTRAYHVVQEGETMFAIAQRYGISTTRLRQLNQMGNGDVPAPFQKLYIE
ncbi:LysM peptidoglycan-binding domain-containing protein [Lewinella sp. 4G2]|uniref:LysM peptidoglycan-binding domain-containing protein n=1 Tax=Lewinella sp. 4G2 TaxID=1803372 RepID=UPI0007B4C663|nr:LysM peptidoglycan-binding domain-containing protein [Lewinella sp. 4G2]OAV46143.1 hypothetical protein A3850_017950 [Lewinella sp. 4G2]